MAQDTEQLLERYRCNNARLRDQLVTVKKRAEGYKEDAHQCRVASELTAKALIDANAELDRLRLDNIQLLLVDSEQWLYDQLRQERTKVALLKEKREAWASLTRRATTAKAAEAQRARELDDLVEEMRQRLVQVEEQRDAAVAQAEKVCAEQKARLDRIEDQCHQWKRGSLATIDAIAGISGEFAGHPLPEPSTWDRMTALVEAQTRSLMCEASDQLAKIEALLEGEGVQLVSTHAKQVRDYIELVKGRIAAAEEGDRGSTGDV